MNNYPRWLSDLLKQAKKNAKARKRECLLTMDDMRQMYDESGGRCELTGIPFNWDRWDGQGDRCPWAPSLDRIDATGNYELENCRLVVMAANYAMHCWGEGVLMDLALSLVKNTDLRYMLD